MERPNANGERDAGEGGLAGVKIFSDLNFNGQPDPGEPTAFTMWNDPNTTHDEAGHYWMAVGEGVQAVREIVPDGFVQTAPGASAAVVRSDTTRVNDGIALDLDLTGAGAAATSAGVVVELELTVVWPDTCGSILSHETTHTVDGSVIFVELFGVQEGDVCAEVIFPQSETVRVDGLEADDYLVVATLNEDLRRFGTGEPGFVETLMVEGGVLIDDGAHVIEIVAGDVIDGLDFGNHRVEPPTGSIHGLKFEDVNANGERDANEPGLAGVTVYLDLNRNGALDDGEPSAETMGPDPAGAFERVGHYWIDGLPAGDYIVREVVPDGFVQTFPLSDAASPLETGAHFVILGPGDVVDGVNFGNHEIEPPTGSIHGLKWADRNANGERDANEPGLPGVTIYVDLNRNGALDADEPSAVTMSFGPDGTTAGSGVYWIDGLPAGEHIVREVVPDGFVQTFPRAIPASPSEVGAHFVVLEPGDVVDGLDFGNHQILPPTGSVHGQKWNDLNGNAARDPDEPGLPGVTIFVDLNFNGQPDDDEPRAITMEDDPDTSVDESGAYWLEDVPSGERVVREVVPDGFMQTFPPSFDFLPPADASNPTAPAIFPNGVHFVFVEPGGRLEGIDFGNQEVRPASIHGLKWADLDGDGQRDSDEPGLAGVVIFSDRNHNGIPDEGEPRAVTMEDDPTTAVDETGRYWLEQLDPGSHVIREVVPDGFIQTFPIGPIPLYPASEPEALIYLPPGAHFVFLGSGQHVDGIDFGNQPVDPGSIHGTKWVDRDGDGERSSGEPGLPGVVIYSDLNQNGVLDDDEPRAVTMEDDPSTSVDETGRYWLDDLDPGRQVIREVVPDGFRQTFPNIYFEGDPSLPDILPPGAHVVFLGSGRRRRRRRLRQPGDRAAHRLGTRPQVARSQPQRRAGPEGARTARRGHLRGSQQQRRTEQSRAARRHDGGQPVHGLRRVGSLLDQRPGARHAHHPRGPATGHGADLPEPGRRRIPRGARRARRRCRRHRLRQPPLHDLRRPHARLARRPR
ncbi:MAG: hypothetical protein CMJ18_13665 [Phycisphaeraceae bacterium]|nr:hypothetical protein [Phycisphaeraceae bacterium]